MLACGPHLQGQLHPLSRLHLLVKELLCSGPGMKTLSSRLCQDQLAAEPLLQSASTLPPVWVSLYTPLWMCTAGKRLGNALPRLQQSLAQHVLLIPSKPSSSGLMPQSDQVFDNSITWLLHVQLLHCS